MTRLHDISRKRTQDLFLVQHCGHGGGVAVAGEYCGCLLLPYLLVTLLREGLPVGAGAGHLLVLVGISRCINWA